MGNVRNRSLVLLVGMSEDGAIEVEENRLTGKSSLCSLGQRLLRRLAKQLEELGARGTLDLPGQQWRRLRESLA